MAFLRAYMRGDPGLFSFLKKAAKVVLPAAALANSKRGLSIAGSVAPGVVGVAARSLVSSPAISGMGGPPPIAVGGFVSPGMAGTLGRAAASLGARILAGGRAASGPIIGGIGSGIGGAIGGRLLNLGGSRTNPVLNVIPGIPSESGVLVPFGTTPRRRYRRMNVTNVRALRKAIRRVKGFAKIARQSLVIEKRVKAPRRRK